MIPTRLTRVIGVALMSAGMTGSAFLEQRAAAPPMDDLVALGTRIHGAFGSYLALGIRIGDEALPRLQAARTEVDVTVIDGPTTPCPCIADGLMIATGATPGRGTLRVAETKAPAGTFGIVMISRLKDGVRLRVVIPSETRLILDQWNILEPQAKLEAVRAADRDRLFRFEIP
ncbi:MAG TPA: formylmethanofuran dehydrogenase subunit E family protein [Burkholderiaceae bacterium]|nr:formylmethanofuran dehydrogenase subunit E family protein [Burkholderiaceae bacterium]